jgi:hypothetical protein
MVCRRMDVFKHPGCDVESRLTKRHCFSQSASLHVCVALVCEGVLPCRRLPWPRRPSWRRRHQPWGQGRRRGRRQGRRRGQGQGQQAWGRGPRRSRQRRHRWTSAWRSRQRHWPGVRWGGTVRKAADEKNPRRNRTVQRLSERVRSEQSLLACPLHTRQNHPGPGIHCTVRSTWRCFHC